MRTHRDVILVVDAPSESDLTALSIDLVDDFADAYGFLASELRHLFQIRSQTSMHRLRLIHEAVLVAAAPSPSLVLDQALAVPA